MPNTSESSDPANKGLIIRGAILVIVVLAAFGVFYARELPFFGGAGDSANFELTTETKLDVPMLLDLGSDKCIPCKEMEPVLEELKNEFEGRMNVRFINVRTNPEEAGNYDIRLIPTQIFYSANGTELFRHEGFFSKEDIMQTWEELGITFAD